jgi:hypothetical protein
MKLSIIRLAALGIVAAVSVPSVAMAQDIATPPPPPPPSSVTTQETTSQATGPSMAMVGSGIVIFGLSYVPAVVVGSTSGLGADRSLLVPLAGPWIDLTQRPGCPAQGSCNGETTNKVLIAVDGVFQAIGAITIVGGFLTTAHETKTVQQSADLSPTLKVSPAQMGSGYGLLAIGTF